MTVAAEAGARVTVKVRLDVPPVPSVTDASLTERAVGGGWQMEIETSSTKKFEFVGAPEVVDSKRIVWLPPSA